MTKRALVPLVAIALGVALGVVALLILTGRPPRSAASDPLTRLSAQCDVAVVVPEPGRLGESLGRLSRLQLAQIGAGLSGARDVDGLAAALANEAGFDVRSPESMRAAGLDPARPLAVSLARAAPLLVLPEADAGKLEALVLRHAENRLGARQKRQLTEGATSVTALFVEGKPAPSLSFAHADGFLLLSTGPGSDKAVHAALAQAPETSLAREPRLLELRDRLAASDAFAFACPGSPTTTALDLPYGAAAALTLSATEVKLAVDVPLTDGLAEAMKSLAKPAGGDLLARLDPAAFLVARFGGDPGWLKPYANNLVPRMFARALGAARIDVGEEVLGNLKPGMALSLSLAPSAQLGQVPRLDPRRTNPFRYVHLQALGRVNDPARALDTLDKVGAVAPRFGTQFEPRDLDGAKVYTATYRLGEGASVALKDDLIAVGGGASQIDALLARAGGTDAPLATRAGLDDAGLMVFLDVSRLTTAVRALPDSTWGIGGFAIKAAVSRWLSAIEELTSLHASAKAEGRLLRGELVLTLRPPADPATKETRR